LRNSRITGLHRLGVGERIGELQRLGWLSDADAELLRNGQHVLAPARADRIIENVIGVFGLPFAIAPNFIVNGRDYIVPMVVEEPSIVAGTSNAARLARPGGGFVAEAAESLLTGQVHVTGVADPDGAIARIHAARERLLAEADALQPRLVERGGGVRELGCHRLELPGNGVAIAVHVHVDTVDAMGANLVNSICESLAPGIARLCGGQPALRILSNLADRALVTASVRYGLRELGNAEFDAEAVRDGIVLASEIASVDPYRAATHNKGIMNGVDAVAVATGNDWRAIEAGAHAFASAGGRYRPLTSWAVGSSGDLEGTLRMPLRVGIVGGTSQANPAAATGLRITGAGSSRELAELMAAVGLAQNFAALNALATSGIQAGHMKLHARSIAAGVGVPDELFDVVVDELIESGEIKARRARDILHARQRSAPSAATSSGKVILAGEHAVVYGRHALALPVRNAVSATVKRSDAGTTLAIPQWRVSEVVADNSRSGVGTAVLRIFDLLGLEGDFSIRVDATLPRAMGLGSSAAVAVAIIRAFDVHLGLGLDNERVNAIAFECEKLAHGTPSGIDNTVATYGEPLLFCNDGGLQVEPLVLAEPLPLLVACSHSPGLTKQQVAGVRARYDAHPLQYESLFDDIDELCLAARDALSQGDYAELGMLMDVCQGLLNAIRVSTPELEAMLALARAAGAAGAKLTGAGGGGSIIALCPERIAEVDAALTGAGFRTLHLS
jgi:hydroxymethylglutaryl-CoA reductase